ncbi:MAG: Rpp14/Pop5 family protein [Candidatus Bathyarchaeia archaeon]
MKGLRYLLIKLVSNDKVSRQSFWNTFHSVLMQIFGEYGFLQADPKIIDYDEDSLEIILMCKKRGLHLVRVTLVFTTKIDNNPIMAYVARVSGTSKKLKDIRQH